MSWIGWAIIVMLLATLVLELVGVKRSDKAQVDTITEVYRMIRDALPRPVAFIWMWAVVGLLFWCGVHFVKGWT